jgi:Rps23 Pro-64 3,4-dihydroxylase Tpa1-like proline 4-hydroxylase
MTSTSGLARLFYFDAGALLRLAAERSADYRTAQPFPHAVIDDFLPEQVAAELLREFPSPAQIEWDRYQDAGHSDKLATSVPERMGPFTRHLLAELNSGAIIEFLETLSGIEGLIPDPHLVGGGLHQIEPGGFLDVHADFNVHQWLRLDRRLNLIVYLNPDWKEEYGGHLELWNAGMSSCVQRVLPVFNRCVIFSTSDVSFHGHPTPLSCPPGMSRKSLAMYYYSNGRPEAERSDSHSTLYQAPRATSGPPDSCRGPLEP